MFLDQCARIIGWTKIKYIFSFLLIRKFVVSLIYVNAFSVERVNVTFSFYYKKSKFVSGRFTWRFI